MSDELLLRWLVDGVLGVALVEAAWLLWRSQRADRPIGPLLANLGAGLALMLALRLALGGAAWFWIAACLALAGVAHLLDLRARWPGLMMPGLAQPGRAVDPPAPTAARSGPIPWPRAPHR